MEPSAPTFPNRGDQAEAKAINLVMSVNTRDLSAGKHRNFYRHSHHTVHRTRRYALRQKMDSKTKVGLALKPWIIITQKNLGLEKSAA